MKILILTDSRTHTKIDSIFRVSRHILTNDDVNLVYVADRADPENEAFFYGCSEACQTLKVTQPDRGWYFDTAPKYEPKTIDAKMPDVIWLRMDHPVEDEFLKFVGRFYKDKFILNDPDGLVKTGSKDYLSALAKDMQDYVPAMQLCETVDDVLTFQKEEPDLVLKHTHSYGGKGVVRLRENGESDINSTEELQAFLDESACLAMRYLDNPDQSDNRVVVIDGKILGAIQRRPAKDGWLCNLSAGGTSEIVEPDQREYEMVEKIDPLMKAEGIFLYGIDTLVDNNDRRMLSEINTLNTGAIIFLEDYQGIPYSKKVANALVRAFGEEQI